MCEWLSPVHTAAFSLVENQITAIWMNNVPIWPVTKLTVSVSGDLYKVL